MCEIPVLSWLEMVPLLIPALFSMLPLGTWAVHVNPIFLMEAYLPID